MGIDILSAKFLKSETRRGVPLGRMLTLGRQSIYMDSGVYPSYLASLGIPSVEPRYADDLFHGLGATTVDVMDASDYEGANVISDLNSPVASHLLGSYDCVFDGGALEHVFNFPVALKNCMEMVKVGGYFITITPTNNYSGHGFYQFSPELLYAALSSANGFSVERLLFVCRDRWYSIRKPEDVKSRVELITDEPTLLFASAKRCEQKPIFSDWPQQSDYVQMWNARESDPRPDRRERSTKDFLVNTIPFAKKFQTSWRAHKRRKQCSPSNTEWFRPVDLD